MLFRSEIFRKYKFLLQNKLFFNFVLLPQKFTSHFDLINSDELSVFDYEVGSVAVEDGWGRGVCEKFEFMIAGTAS